MKTYGLLMSLRIIINVIVWFFAAYSFNQWVKKKTKKERFWYNLLLVAVFIIWVYAEMSIGEGP